MVAGHRFFEQLAQGGDIPLPIAQLKNYGALRILGDEPEIFVESGVGGVDPQVCAQDNQRLMKGIEDGLGIVTRFRGAFQLVDIDQQENRSVDFMFGGPIGMGAQEQPAALAVLDFALLDDYVPDDFRQEGFQIESFNRGSEVADRTANVSGNELQSQPGCNVKGADARFEA